MMTTWEEIRDEVAGMLADGKSLEDVISKLEKRKNEMAKANLLKVMDDIKKQKQTNDEWRRTCSTEEFAEFLFDIGEYDWLNEIAVTSEKALRITDIVEWLKQPHTPKE